MMKKIIYIILLIVVFGCQKETMNNPVSLESVYQIKDNPDDPVQHERYLLHQEFNVAVFFTDTIGQELLKYDKDGQPVYRTEMLDLGWLFSGYSRSKYNFVYIKDQAEQLAFLQVIRSYVSEAGPKLTPFSILAVASMKIIDPSTGKVTENYSIGQFKNYFRTLVMTNGWAAANLKTLNTTIMKEMLKQKIGNYKHLLGGFFEVSDPLWYGKYWKELDAGIVPPRDMPAFNAGPLYNDNYQWPSFYNSQYRKDSVCVYIRAVTGRFGFVHGGEIGKAGGIVSPEDTDKDLGGYVNAMLKNPGEKFDSLWKDSPLVMKKYKVLRTVIFENIGIDL